MNAMFSFQYPYIYTNRNSVSISSNYGAYAKPDMASSSDVTASTGSLGGGAITAVIFLVFAVIFVSGYVVYRRVHISRWSYDSL